MNKTLKQILEHLREIGAGSDAELYVQNNLILARQVVADLATVNGNVAFHYWKQRALELFKLQAQQGEEAWQAWLLNAAYEEFKAAKESNWFKRVFGKFFGWLTRNGLDVFVIAWTKPLLEELKKIPSAERNADVKALGDRLFGILKSQSKQSKDTWIALVVQGAIAVALKRGIILAD